MPAAQFVQREEDIANDEYTAVVQCPFCGKKDEFKVKGPELFLYRQGEFVQQAFVSLNADRREQIMTGVDQKCWDEKMKDPDE